MTNAVGESQYDCTFLLDCNRTMFALPTLATTLLLFAQAPAQQPPATNVQQLRQCGEKAFQAKNWPEAEKCLTPYVAEQPNDGIANYELGTALLMQKDPGMLAAGQFYYARAAILLREPGLKRWVKLEYTNVHRSPLGLDRYWEYVRTHTVAPESVADYPRPPDEQFGGMTLMMQELRTALEGPNAAQFFDDVLSQNTIPVLRGKLMAQKPEDKPRELWLAVGSLDEADVRLVLNRNLPKAAPLGTMVDFEGVIKGWDKQPFALVFDVPADGIHGWPK